MEVRVGLDIGKGRRRLQGSEGRGEREARGGASVQRDPTDV